MGMTSSLVTMQNLARVVPSEDTKAMEVWGARLGLAWFIFKVVTFIGLMIAGCKMFSSQRKQGTMDNKQVVLFGILMIAVFGVSFSKIFEDNLWVVFLMQYCGSLLVQFIFTYSFLPLYWKSDKLTPTIDALYIG